MKARINLFILSILFAYSCDGQDKSSRVFLPPRTKVAVFTRNIGVVVFKQKEENKDRSFTLYNNDTSEWQSFKLNDDFNDDSIRPYAIKPENTLLVFRCVGELDGFYTVLINEEKNLKKLVKKSDKNFKFQLWEEHIVSEVFSIEFDQNSNPIKEVPSKDSKFIKYDIDETYHPVKVKGDWLQIKWGNEDDWNYGWIRWKEGTTLIVEIFYFA